MGGILIKLKHQLLSMIASSPVLLSYFYGRYSKYNALLVTPQTDIVIEGFPRCANTFAVITFSKAQKHNYLIAHHLHAEAQLTLAVKHNIPTIALIRDPLEAISSLIVRDPTFSIEQALHRYINFYTVVNELRNSLVIAEFSDVTHGFNKIIARCNSKFSTDFSLPSNSEQNTNEVFNKIKIINKNNEKGSIDMLAMPDNGRNEKKSQLKTQIVSAPLFLIAEQLFNELTTRD